MTSRNVNPGERATHDGVRRILHPIFFRAAAHSQIVPATPASLWNFNNRSRIGCGIVTEDPASASTNTSMVS